MYTKSTEINNSQPDISSQVERVVTEVGKVVLGKQQQVKLALCCLLSRGHLLLEDYPGMGKTTLSQALAAVLGLEYKRVQFTSDLLPADVLGVSIYDRNSGAFEFHEGPVFTNLLLADEINRTTPKTQSALLEAMEEGQVSVDGKTRALPVPFFVIATQNPLNFSGTFPLPESQLDRFLMRLQLGYPDPEAERELLVMQNQRERLQDIVQCLTTDDIQSISQQADSVHATDSLLDYVQRLVTFSRQASRFSFGLSPRGGQALMRCSRTWALMQGRKHVLPEDVQAVLPAVVDHRLRSVTEKASGAEGGLSSVLLNEVDLF